MEILIYLFSLAITALLYVIPTALFYSDTALKLSTVVREVIGPTIYMVLWLLLIIHRHNKPKSLWRFVAEWGFFLSYLVFHLVVYTDHLNVLNAMFDPYSIKGFMIIPCLLVFFSAGFMTMYVWPIFSVAALLLCIIFLIRHYKQTGKLW